MAFARSTLFQLPDELNDFEDEEVQVRSGTYTGTIKAIICVSGICAPSWLR